MEFDLEQFSTSLVTAMSEAVIYADADGTIRWWNGGAERMFGYSSKEAIGQSLDLIIPENLRARHWEGYYHTMETGETRYDGGALLSVPAIRKDGSRISVEFTIVPFRDDVGRMTALAAVMRDATKQFEEMRALRKQVAQYAAITRQSKGSEATTG